MTLSNVSTLTLTAAVKALGDEIKSRDDLDPGSYSVNDSLSFTLVGNVSVNGKETYIPTIAIPLKVTMALFVRYSGITGDRALQALEQAMSEALTLGEKGESHVAEVAMLDKAEEKVKLMLGELPKKTRKGKVQSRWW